MNKIKVNVSSSYDIIIERGSIYNCGNIISDIVSSRNVVIVTDDIVDNLYGKIVSDSLCKNGFTCNTFVFQNGEKSKNSTTLNNIYNFLCENNITRSDIIIALGGGVVGDITGFAAATFLRGIDFIQIPTTLLAQIDSSVGGKTAIDIEAGKNLVGAFKQPKLVICDSDTLKTLSPEILSDGMAEAIKYGMIKDNLLFDMIASHNINDVDLIMDEIVYRCIDLKRIVVEEDEFDCGERMILNFGHTFGHAVEGYYNYETYSHGKGVAIGMYIMTKKFCNDKITEKLLKCLEAYKLPHNIEVSINELIPYCANDKKREQSNINYIVCRTIGKAEIIKTPFTEFKSIFMEV